MPGWCGVVSARSVDVSIRSPEKFKRLYFPLSFLYLFLYFVQKIVFPLSFLYLFLYFGPKVVFILVFPVFLLLFWSRSCFYPCLSCISSCIFSPWIPSKGFYSSFPPLESSSIKNTKILINVPKFSSSSCFPSPQ